MQFSQKTEYFSKHKLLPVHLTWLPQVCREMLILVIKHPGVLVLVCHIKFFSYTINYKLIFMADVIAMFILADVVPKVVAAIIANKVCLFCGRWKATVVDATTM